MHLQETEEQLATLKTSAEAERATMHAALEATKGQLEVSVSDNKALSEQVTISS